MLVRTIAIRLSAFCKICIDNTMARHNSIFLSVKKQFRMTQLHIIYTITLSKSEMSFIKL